MLLTSIAMYAAVWHRGRQSLGVARFYQRGMGGPDVARRTIGLFRGAIYLPMVAGTLAYTHLAPADDEGKPYLALSSGAEFTSLVGLGRSGSWVIAYLAWRALAQPRGGRGSRVSDWLGLVHPGEWWVVLAHAVAFRQRLRARGVERVVSVGARRAS